MMNDTAALHAVVMSAADDPAVANQHRANRDAARAQSEPCFVYRALEEVIDAASLALTTAMTIKSAGWPNVALLPTMPP
jgi:hypothetical protein